MKITVTDPDIRSIVNRIEDGTYDLEPDFQRDLVWSIEKQQKLIDSIIRKWHIPPIHLVKVEGKEKYEVLDGKQRLYSIYNFVTDRFPFNGNFLPGVDDFSQFHLKHFSEFPSGLQKEIEMSPIRIFKVTEVKMDEATELFLRLNQGVNVSASEKRNCIYGPVKEFLRQMLNSHPKLFCDSTLGFENKRMAYQDSLDKIFFLEKIESLEFKPTSRILEKMYFEKKIDGRIQQNLDRNLDLVESTISGFNKMHGFKLTKSVLLSYYWFLRELNKQDRFNKKNASEFLINFERWRNEQKSFYESDLDEVNYRVNKKYVEFNTYLSKGWLDPSSLKGRHRILMEFYEKFLNTGVLEEKNDF
ncbi:MAG: DUF262 domain-containing protein [Methanoregula sp.]|nr:DUF262 domain-containing protein [Methanoregula sp.]